MRRATPSTYGPHLPSGDSTNKLYEIDDRLMRTTRVESLGGTPANRFIHEPSGQLIIGPHFVDASRNVRNLPYSLAPGRITATGQSRAEDGIHVTFESCTDLESWIPRPTLVTPHPDQSGVPSGFTRWQFAFDPGSEPARFVRITTTL